MKYQLILVLLCAVFVNSKPIEQNENCQKHKGIEIVDPDVGVPLNREKRQTGVNLSNTGFGVSHTGTILDTPKHNLAGTAFGQKQFGGPLTYGGGLKYEHVPTGSDILVTGSKTGGIKGADLGVQANYNILNNANTKFTASGTANQHLGGPYGNPLTVGGNLNYQHSPSGSGVSLTGSHTKGMGTDLGIKGNYNIYKSPNGNTQLGLTGSYDRHFGGPGGTTHPNYGAFFNFRRDFKK